MQIAATAANSAISGDAMERADLEYVGFWPRVGATIIDTLLIGFICWPLLTAVYGSSYWEGGMSLRGPADLLISWIFPAIATVLFWAQWQATPGKMAVSARIVDATTGRTPSFGQLVGRYLGYFLSAIPFCLGFIWVGFDPRRQGWHDKLAGTVVIRSKERRPAAVRFDG
jgi:uncharacterized RDD family membrane protein YckC